MKENRKLLPYEGKDIIPNEERKKFGLAPIPGGDVSIRCLSDSNKELKRVEVR